MSLLLLFLTQGGAPPVVPGTTTTLADPNTTFWITMFGQDHEFQAPSYNRRRRAREREREEAHIA